MGNENGTVQIIYNGELYNFLDLKRRFALEEKGHVFRSRTDTEVLIHLFEELGPSMAAHLNGHVRVRDLGRGAGSSCIWRATRTGSSRCFTSATASTCDSDPRSRPSWRTRA